MWHLNVPLMHVKCFFYPPKTLSSSRQSTAWIQRGQTCKHSSAFLLYIHHHLMTHSGDLWHINNYRNVKFIWSDSLLSVGFLFWFELEFCLFKNLALVCHRIKCCSTIFGNGRFQVFFLLWPLKCKRDFKDFLEKDRWSHKM